MKKAAITKLYYIVSILLVILFFIKNVVDYSTYTTTLNSAPFYVWSAVNALYFLVPAVIVFIVGVIIKKKQ